MASENDRKKAAKIEDLIVIFLGVDLFSNGKVRF
jgi:hypothetical protein